jgi:hypothetical protein
MLLLVGETTDTVDRSGMVEIVGNRSDFVEIRSENR